MDINVELITNYYGDDYDVVWEEGEYDIIVYAGLNDIETVEENKEEYLSSNDEHYTATFDLGNSSVNSDCNRSD